jgi:hypothetical protein
MLTPDERRALTISTFAAACLCFAPAQIVSGVALLIVSGILHLRDQRLLRLSEAAAPPVALAGTPEPAEGAQEAGARSTPAP